MTDGSGIRNGTHSQQSARRNSASLATSKPYSEPEWLEEQLLALAEIMAVSLTEQQYALYVDLLREIPERRLRVAFRRAAQELKFFPKPAELIELSELIPQPDVREWKGPTEQERAQRDRDNQSGENAGWWAQMKSVAEQKRMEKCVEVKEVFRAPIREMSDAEVAARLDLLRQQKEIVLKRAAEGAYQ